MSTADKLFMANLNKQAKVQEKAKKAEREQVFDELEHLGIETVAVEYDGEGDNGGINSIQEDGEKQLTTELKTTIEELCYNILGDKFGGWEIGGGSYGHMHFDVATRKITFEHNERVESVDTTEGQI